MSPLTQAKPHLNIGTIGHLDHGKTTLTAAITKVLSARGTSTLVPPEHLDRAPGEVTRGLSVAPGHVEYATDTRHYAHLDLPGRADLVQHVIIGAAQLDGAILVVSALEGVMPQTVEHVVVARQLGVEHLVVALTKTDVSDAGLTELVEREVRGLLTAHGYAGPFLPVVRVSGTRALHGDPRWVATVEALLDAVDTWVPVPHRHRAAPLLLPVAHALTRTGRGTVVTGVIERGSVRPGDRVLLHGDDPAGTESQVTGVETFGRPLAYAEAGDSVALLLRGVPRRAVRRGQVVAAPGSVTPRTAFTARVHLLSPDEGGRRTPVASGYRPHFHLRTADVVGEVDLGARGAARPGDTVTMAVRLGRGLPLEPGLGFAVRDGGHAVGAGRVTALPGADGGR